MSSGYPPQSPAVAKTEVPLDGECPLLAATFAYWDNILGPRVRHIWAPRVDQSLLLSDGEITFLANHTLNGEILRSAECGAVDVKFFVLAEKGVIIVSLIFDGELKGDKNTCALSIILPQTELAFYLPLHAICVERFQHVIRKGRIWMQKGYNIISVLSSEILPIMELLASMKTHRVQEDIDIRDTVLNDDDIGDSCHEDFLHKAISSHLQTCGCSMVVGSNPDKVNKMVRTLCLFLTPSERKCSRLCKADSSFKYETGLFVQGLLKDSTGSFVLPFRQVLYSPYPTTHIDVDINTVKQMPPCQEHTYNQRRYMRSELSALWRAVSEDDIAPDMIIHTDEGFTPDLNIFQDVMHRDTLVKSFIDEVFMLKPSLSLRSTYVTQFLLLIHRKALTLLKYIEDETQKGKKPFRSLRSLKADLDLAVDGDLSIVMALAEKLRAGLHSFVFGVPCYTSAQDRDVHMNL
ncbi:guanine nucleotide exchange factor C9orf72 homolog [Gadus chalcogrammus]|uniref:guanine nucleotide exchange factor C9orf72 homolog n=1 Tax=Gadus chalcogrammus TaxID=1042646 RepID=UPI0024C3941C|nr:guanine nucleotide exchange factor C9orf72 homolog [Gadus chalcogrammus]XP_056446346.1 guanine nucleotide exchange factor C9orf72 homolog [Gadus chalcogrammus]XP_056446347.1 guanine nucleotide exchange factor C9orf72 homolog [Gadus chalcogrammus]XP_056446348.1 guanine nucleotide exchange factor C9orf72 homolog [Gadus chalcogrammus]XP_056446349.1 guanine nucleotide exchange factor C9orf72 homolog [Gadus chalcogrammus]